MNCPQFKSNQGSTLHIIPPLSALISCHPRSRIDFFLMRPLGPRRELKKEDHPLLGEIGREEEEEIRRSNKEN